LEFLGGKTGVQELQKKNLEFRSQNSGVELAFYLLIEVPGNGFY
jgi:hypothetical protein